MRYTLTLVRVPDPDRKHDEPEQVFESRTDRDDMLMRELLAAVADHALTGEPGERFVFTVSIE